MRLAGCFADSIRPVRITVILLRNDRKFVAVRIIVSWNKVNLTLNVPKTTTFLGASGDDMANSKHNCNFFHSDIRYRVRSGQSIIALNIRGPMRQACAILPKRQEEILPLYLGTEVFSCVLRVQNIQVDVPAS